MKNFTVEDIKAAIHKFDIINRPLIVFMHPKDAEDLKLAYPDIEDQIVIHKTPLIEKGTAICGKREDFEPADHFFNI